MPNLTDDLQSKKSEYIQFAELIKALHKLLKHEFENLHPAFLKELTDFPAYAKVASLIGQASSGKAHSYLQKNDSSHSSGFSKRFDGNALSTKRKIGSFYRMIPLVSAASEDCLDNNTSSASSSQITLKSILKRAEERLMELQDEIEHLEVSIRLNNSCLDERILPISSPDLSPIKHEQVNTLEGDSQFRLTEVSEDSGLFSPTRTNPHVASNFALNLKEVLPFGVRSANPFMCSPTILDPSVSLTEEVSHDNQIFTFGELETNKENLGNTQDYPKYSRNDPTQEFSLQDLAKETNRTLKNSPQCSLDQLDNDSNQLPEEIPPAQLLTNDKNDSQVRRTLPVITWVKQGEQKHNLFFKPLLLREDRSEEVDIQPLVGENERLLSESQLPSEGAKPHSKGTTKTNAEQDHLVNEKTRCCTIF